jgi:hypothetical protein
MGSAPVRVLLHDNQLCERGTTTSMLDYARALRRLGHEVEISYWSDSPANVPAVIARVGDEFMLHPHRDRFELPASARDFDAGYFIKAGQRDGLVLPEGRSFVHAVFQNYDPHGTRYSYISRWLAQAVRQQTLSKVGSREGLVELGQEAGRAGCINALDFEHLDLIVDVATPEHGIRAQLGIPEEAFAILRFGGWDTFDISWVQDVVVRELDRHPDWYFIGLNTAPFTDHPRAIYVPMVMDPVEKASIIASADVFLTARGQGEAFGVAVAEALQIGIPVLAWNGGTDQAHVDMLRGLGALFTRPMDLRWRLRRLARGKDPSSVAARQERGNSFRPAVVAPELVHQLSPVASE